jgi:hypothetical protein
LNITQHSFQSSLYLLIIAFSRNFVHKINEEISVIRNRQFRRKTKDTCFAGETNPEKQVSFFLEQGRAAVVQGSRKTGISSGTAGTGGLLVQRN